MRPASKNQLPRVSPGDLKIVPLERAETIPSTWYSDPGFHAFDQQSIFSQTWQNIGHLSRLPNPGDQIVATVAGNPILAVKGQDSVVRSFYNICRHRGGPLALEDCNSKVLQCKYHGWTYLLDGSLRGTPRFDRTELFDKKDYGLVPVALDTWESLLFVKLSKNSTSLGKVFEGIKQRIAPHYSLATMKFHRRVVYPVQCNWKVYVDNYLEGYHLPFVHPELCNLLDYQNYVTETFEYSSLQHSPIRQTKSPYGGGEGPAYYFFVWPNFMVNMLPGRVQTNVVCPVTPNTCEVHFDYYYEDITSEEAQKRAEEDVAYSDRVQKEDSEICERVQKGLESQAYDKGRFSVECENGVYHFQCLLKRAYRTALSRRKDSK